MKFTEHLLGDRDYTKNFILNISFNLMQYFIIITVILEKKNSGTENLSNRPKFV